MSPFTARAALLASIAWLPLSGFAHAQDRAQDSAPDAGQNTRDDATALPKITVRAPSPIVRRRPAQPAPPGERAPVQVTVTPNAPLLGNVPIVSDQFATVTIMPREER